jgi:chromosome segregation ATPase
VKKARDELATEKRTAASSQTAEKPREDLPLPVLEAKRKYLEEQLAEMNKAVARKTDEVAGLESFSAEVAAKQEDLKALSAILTELRTRLDRAEVERLANERISLVDKATVADAAGNVTRRNAGILTLAGFGLGFVALGVLLQVEARKTLG